MSGKKNDMGKPDLSLVPLSALEEEAKGFMLGEKKYGRYNYMAGLEASRLIGAALRHIHAWNTGEDLDPESGASHLGHARCCLAMVLECQRLGTLKDNRYQKEGDLSIYQIQRTKEVQREVETTTRLADGNELVWGAGSSRVLDYIK